MSLCWTFFYSPTHATPYNAARQQAEGADEEQTTWRYFSLAEDGGREGGRATAALFCLQADGFLSLKEELWKNGHKRWSHRELCFLFRSLAPLFRRGFVRAQRSGLLSAAYTDSWPHGTAGHDTVRQQDASTLNKTAPQRLRQKEKWTRCAAV